MRYELPEEMNRSKAPDWPVGAGGIPARLSDGTAAEIPVLQGMNAIVFGVVGTGKTKSYILPAAEVLLTAVPDMKAVFFEIKRSFLDRFMKPEDKVISHNPAAVQPRNLFQWCLIKEIRQAKDQEAEMKQIAEFLFSDLLDEANQNRGWVESARNTFIGVLRVVVGCFPDNTTNWTLIHALRRMPVGELLAYLAKHPRNHSLLRKDFGFEPDHPAGYQPTRRAEDIMFFFNQVLEKFSGTFESRGQDTIQSFLHTGGQNLFILYDLAAAEVSRPFILYFLKKIKDEKMSNMSDVKAPMLWCMDEIDKLSDGGKSADFGLYQAATLGREYNLQILLATQSVEHLYGLAPGFNEHLANGGLAGFPVVLCFRPGDPATVRTLQTLYGSRHREYIVMPASRYDHPVVRYELEPIVTDSDFAGLGTGECYVKIGACPPQKASIICKSP